MAPKISHYREWHFSTVTDLRQWLLHNRDAIRAAKYEPRFTVHIDGDHPVPVLDGHCEGTELWTEHAAGCDPKRCFGQCHTDCCTKDGGK